MLQKGFFITKSFNWAGRTLVNLSGSQQFVENTVFPKGVYSIDVVAGSTFYGISADEPMQSDNGKGVGGRVYTEVTIREPFIIRAYCGSKGGYGVGGTNPYAGPFKVNASYYEGTPAAVSHIFGNVGGSSKYISSNPTTLYPGSGNCLGDGVGVTTPNVSKYGIGAGSCVHFIPVGGTFGTNYLFAAHCGAAATGWHGTPFRLAGNGSVYGGAAGSIGRTVEGAYNVVGWNGGSTPYGTGGTASIVPGLIVYGASDGTGVGAGKMVSGWPTKGAAAYFQDGVWKNSTLFGNQEEDGYIIVSFVRPI